MDTKILIVTAIGSSLTMVLLFRRTVLSVKWWKKYIFTNSENGRGRQGQEEQQKLEDANITLTSNHHHMTQSKSQSLVHVEKLSKWNYDLFKNKEVFTCEMVDIGYISMVENQFMTIIRNGRSGQQQYLIPIYYVREHDNERVLIDTSIRYLDRYQVKETVST